MEGTHVVALSLIIAIIYLFRLICILPFCHTSEDAKHDVKFKTEVAGETGNLNHDYEKFSFKGIKLSLRQPNLQLFLFLGSGGHTGEMLRLVTNYSTVLLNKDTTIHVGYSDDASKKKFERLIQPMDCKVTFYEFKKAREVNANLLQSIQTIFFTLLTSLKNIITIKWYMLGKPHLVLLNGPGTCCIITVWFKLLDLLLLFSSSNIIYVESLARISTLSLTGKILYWLADEFIVQWEELKLKGVLRAKYYGILV